MELYEKIVIATAMGAYLAYLIYKNRGMFSKNKDKDDSNKGCGCGC